VPTLLETLKLVREVAVPLWHLDPEKINIRLETCSNVNGAPHVRAVPVYEETPVADLKTHQWDSMTFEGTGSNETEALNALLLVLSYRLDELVGAIKGRPEAFRRISGYENV